MTEVLIVAGVIGYLSGLVRMHLDRWRFWWSYASVGVGVGLLYVVDGGLLLNEVLGGITAAFIGLAVEAVVHHYTSGPQVIRRR